MHNTYLTVFTGPEIGQQKYMEFSYKFGPSDEDEYELNLFL